MGPNEITPSSPVSGFGVGVDGGCARTTRENKAKSTKSIGRKYGLRMDSNDTQYPFVAKSLVCFCTKRCINLHAQAILGLWRKLNLLSVDKHDGRPIYAERSTAILIGSDALCHLI